MKTKLTLFITALLFGGLSLASCEDENKRTDLDREEAKVKVENVEWKSDLKDGFDVVLGNNSLNVANRMNIYPENASNQKQAFASSNTAIATITEFGQITPVALGSTTITVTVDGHSAGFTLTVVEPAEEPTVPVTEINIPEPTVMVMTGTPKSLTTLFTVLPDNATDKSVTYSSLDETVATVSEAGLVTGLKIGGSTTITVTSVDEPTVSNTFTVNVGGDYTPRNAWTVENMYPALFEGESATIIEGMFDGNTGTWLSFVKPGEGHSGTGKPPVSNPTIANGGYISFTVDMKEAKKVNYFRIRWRNNNTPGMRFIGFQTISGSNDNVNFTDIATDFRIPNYNASAFETVNMSITEGTYRYIKFDIRTADYYLGGPSTLAKGNKTISVAELYFGLGEVEND